MTKSASAKSGFPFPGLDSTGCKRKIFRCSIYDLQLDKEIYELRICMHTFTPRGPWAADETPAARQMIHKNNYVNKAREQMKNRYRSIPEALLRRWDDRLKAIVRYTWLKSALRRLTASRCAAKWQFTKHMIRSYTLSRKPTPPWIGKWGSIKHTKIMKSIKGVIILFLSWKKTWFWNMICGKIFYGN